MACVWRGVTLPPALITERVCGTEGNSYSLSTWAVMNTHLDNITGPGDLMSALRVHSVIVGPESTCILHSDIHSTVIAVCGTCCSYHGRGALRFSRYFCHILEPCIVSLTSLKKILKKRACALLSFLTFHKLSTEYGIEAYFINWGQLFPIISMYYCNII
jgi:hypothetical protein